MNSLSIAEAEAYAALKAANISADAAYTKVTAAIAEVKDTNAVNAAIADFNIANAKVTTAAAAFDAAVTAAKEINHERK